METISTLRFGTAARNIKNTPKINKELTVGELKKLLTKSERIIALKTYRVDILEKHITVNDLVVPEDEYKDEVQTMAKFSSPSKTEMSRASIVESEISEIVEEDKDESEIEIEKPIDSDEDKEDDGFEVIYNGDQKEEEEEEKVVKSEW